MSKLLIENKTEVNLSFDIEKIESWISKCIPDDKKLIGLQYYFVDDEELRKMNKDFLDHDYYTDIVSFDYCRGKRIKGECWISLDRIKDNAENLNLEFEKEMYRVMIHGLLHFLGFGDKTKEEKNVMRSKEDECLKLF